MTASYQTCGRTEEQHDAIRQRGLDVLAKEARRRIALDALLPELLAALGEHPLALRLRELLP